MADQHPAGFVPDGFVPDASSHTPSAQEAAAAKYGVDPNAPLGSMGTVMQPYTATRGERVLHEPIAHPTGTALDEFLTPANFILGAVMAAPKAMSLASSAAEGLAAKIGPSAAGKLLKFITPSFIKKPAEFADLLSELGQAKPSAPASPTAQSAATPASAPVTAGASPPTAAPAAPAVPVGPVAPPMSLAKRMGVFDLAARRAGVTLSPNDYVGLNTAVRAGAEPAEAVASLIAERAPAAASPADALLQRLKANGGALSDEEVHAALDARNARGEIKTPSAQTARARKAARP